MKRNKRELVLDLLDGQSPSRYVPAGFFIHFDTEHHRGQAAIDRHLEYFRFTDMDFVKIQYEGGFPRQTDIEKPADWARFSMPGKDFYEEPLRVVEGLVKAVKREALVVVTLYSPFMLASRVIDKARMVEHIEKEPDLARKGIEIATQSLLIFVRECIRLGVDGFYASTQGGERGRFSRPELFTECVKPYDLRIWEEISAACRFNILHVCDYHLPYDELTPFLDYPGDVVSCPLHLAGEKLSPRRATELFGRPALGGMDRKGVIAHGSHDEIRTEVEGLLAGAGDRYILGADCTLPSDVDWENIRTAIAAAHDHRPVVQSPGMGARGNVE
jgi:uroporphyrinogen decarboxylase